LKKIIMYG